MTDIDVSYNMATGKSLSDYVTPINQRELGIQKLSNAMINFRITDCANMQIPHKPLRLMRILADNGGCKP